MLGGAAISGGACVEVPGTVSVGGGGVTGAVLMPSMTEDFPETTWYRAIIRLAIITIAALHMVVRNKKVVPPVLPKIL